MDKTGGRGPRVICAGQAVVDCITRNITEDPDRPEARKAESISLRIGGDAVNEASALVKLGIPADVLIAVGDDPAGDMLRTILQKRGVGTSGIRVMEAPFSTPVANLLVKPDGSRSSVNSEATLLPGFLPGEADLRKLCPEGADFPEILSFASLFRAPFTDPDRIKDLVLSAEKLGMRIYADTKLPTFRKITLHDIKDVLPHLSCMFPNEREAEYYTGKTSLPEMADVFLGYGLKRVVIKTGPDGCYARSSVPGELPDDMTLKKAPSGGGRIEGGGFTLPALPVKAVDTTGAGDHFVAGYLAAVLSGGSFFDCCLSGILLAGESIQRIGGG